ncbi:MAG: hypothetical protein AMJ54_12540 [Deltaproteobacteria bacterium SG8_13]|nr:MAG: hypothetical protein AMJ54_12540 [Deltaproteobacteria bacterium SG8_13]
MKAKTGKKFTVPDLKAKVRTLEAVFGEKHMRRQLNPRTVDKWLRDPEPTPYLTSLKCYFGVIGLKESDMLKARDAFADEVSRICARQFPDSGVRYGADDIATIYDSFAGPDARSHTALLGRTLKMIQKETARNDYEYLKGYYHMYHHWKSGQTGAGDNIRRNLVQIYDFDENQGLMSCRILVSPMKCRNKEDWWVYEGWVVNIKNKLFWLFECVKGMPPELVTLSIFKPSFWPEPDHFVLYGILSALTLEGNPCASKFILNKIEADDQLRDHIGYFTAEEIRAEGHRIDILRCIDNRVPGAGDLLSASPTGS